LNALPKNYETFVKGIVAHDDLPNFDKLMGKLFNESHCKELKNSKRLDDET
jgi:hypothetical protein